MDSWQVVMAVLMGFSLAATCGLRAFLPLLVISIAAKAGYIDLAGNFAWMNSWVAIICFGAATVLEILGDKIPAVDHFLDASGVVVRPVAGAVAASSLISGMDPLLSLVIGVIMGGSIAGIVQAVKGSLRIFSTASTGGLANPLVSLVEDSAAGIGSVAGLIIPLVTTILLVVAIILIARFAMLQRSKRTCGKLGTPEQRAVIT